MPTPGERRALTFLAAIAALGVAVRGWREFHAPPGAPIGTGRSALAHQIGAVDSAIAAGGARRRPRGPEPPDPQAREVQPKRAARRPSGAPADPGEPRRPRSRGDAAESPSRSAARRPGSWGTRPPVDLDTAAPDEIAAIPAIGPALARRIVADRIEYGPFGSIDGVERVRGISRSLARRFQPYVTFSLAPRSERAGAKAPTTSGAQVNRATPRRRPSGGDARP